jgi:hypothetical protein
MHNPLVFYGKNNQKIEFFITKEFVRLTMFRDDKYMILEFNHDEIRRFINIVKMIENYL